MYELLGLLSLLLQATTWLLLLGFGAWLLPVVQGQVGRPPTGV
ncbi:MAG TPA: hypothetical protein VH682_15505 [Gemmataceae bacterium]|jgi:hypothetical protein